MKISQSLNLYTRLFRLDKPIGIFLLFWPCTWPLAVNTETPWFYYLFFFTGAVLLRSAGCVINDIFDKDIDKKVTRTRNRPLASEEISIINALKSLFILLCFGFFILVQFNILTIILGCSSLLLVILYPLMKRFTWWPQAFLGITFNWGVLMGATSISGTLNQGFILLYIGAVFWTIGYDTIYAHQDKEDDLKIGVKSTAILFKDYTKIWVALFYLLFSICLGLVGKLLNLGSMYYYTIGLITLILALQVWRVDLSNGNSCLKAFKQNQWIGFLIFAAFILDNILVF